MLKVFSNADMFKHEVEMLKKAKGVPNIIAIQDTLDGVDGKKIIVLDYFEKNLGDLINEYKERLKDGQESLLPSPTRNGANGRHRKDGVRHFRDIAEGLKVTEPTHLMQV